MAKDKPKTKIKIDQTALWHIYHTIMVIGIYLVVIIEFVELMWRI
jgi:hypothetical protein